MATRRTGGKAGAPGDGKAGRRPAKKSPARAAAPATTAQAGATPATRKMPTKKGPAPTRAAAPAAAGPAPGPAAEAARAADAAPRAAEGKARAASPIAGFEAMVEASGKAQQALLDMWLKAMPDGAQQSAGLAALFEPFSQWAEAGRKLLAAPGEGPGQAWAKLWEGWWTDSVKLWSGIVAGKSEEIPEAARKLDRRFAGEAWGATPLFDLMRRSYLLSAHYLMEATSLPAPIPDEMKERLRFQMRQLVEAMSPANFPALNPEVLEKAKETGGQSLVRGFEHLARDIQQGKLTMTDETAFEVGRNVAATPGKVVFENRLFQLIHYAPATPTQYEVPLLIFPPWINKFYILDLTPEKSFIAWAVAQGLSVFVVSWAQATPALADVTVDSYVGEGYLTAIDTVRAICDTPAVHTIGYCVAGTTLAIALAVLAARGEADKVKTATFFTAQTDFTEAGDLLHFIDDAMLAQIEGLGEDGVFDGRYLALTFNMLRPSDLIWSYVVNNYLMGKDYAPFDLLYWNSDPTSVPARWHLDYLKDLYRDNRLATPGGLTVLGVPVDLSTIRTPAYVQAGKEDHIAPAVSSFKLTQQLKGPVRFMLAGSGHIAGVVNPPSANKYQYWTLPEGVPTPATLEAFRAAAVETRGSWWPDWIAWLAPQSGDQVPARVPGTAQGFPAIEDAPGRYVKVRIA